MCMDACHWNDVTGPLRDDCLVEANIVIGHATRREALLELAAHGFPVRALVPGWIGARSVKWLGRIDVTAEPSPNYFQTRAYRMAREVNHTDPRDVSGGTALTEVPLNTVILEPATGAVLHAGRHRVRGWADALGRVIRHMHDRQVAHRDLKAPNILMAGAARDPQAATPVLIDLVGVVPGRVVDARTRVRNLARLSASFLHIPHVSRTDRLRFLRAYLAWGLRGKGDWKSWWERVAAATREKVAKNARAGRPHSVHRLRPVHLLERRPGSRSGARHDVLHSGASGGARQLFRARLARQAARKQGRPADESLGPASW